MTAVEAIKVARDTYPWAKCIVRNADNNWIACEHKPTEKNSSGWLFVGNHEILGYDSKWVSDVYDIKRPTA